LKLPQKQNKLKTTSKEKYKLITKKLKHTMNTITNTTTIMITKTINTTNKKYLSLRPTTSKMNELFFAFHIFLNHI
jgi:hypothetical protein